MLQVKMLIRYLILNENVQQIMSHVMRKPDLLHMRTTKAH